MDQLLFNPGWVQSSREEFQARLRAALDGDDRGWVADGNYAGMGGDIAQEMATDVICQYLDDETHFTLNLLEYCRARPPALHLFPPPDLAYIPATLPRGAPLLAWVLRESHRDVLFT